MTDFNNCRDKHCNTETYGSMSFFAIYLVILFVLSAFGLVFLLIN